MALTRLTSGPKLPALLGLLLGIGGTLVALALLGDSRSEQTDLNVAQPGEGLPSESGLDRDELRSPGRREPIPFEVPMGAGAPGSVDQGILDSEDVAARPGRGYPRGSRPWVLDYTLREFRGEELADPQWENVDKETLARLTVGMSMAAILDALGRSTEDSADYEFPTDPRIHSFFYNGRNYEFLRGEFPVYEALQEYFEEVKRWNPTVSANGDAGPRPMMGEDLQLQITAFAEEAMGYLALRKW